MRKFNVAGVCFPERHYMLPAEARLPGVRGLVDDGSFFVVHAPRQTGKTTSLRTLAQNLTAEGRYAALHFSCEAGQAFSDDVAAAELAVMRSMLRSAATVLPAELQPPALPESGPGSRIHDGLSLWAQACPRPLVLIFDEIDALLGDSLVSVLRQLRAGHPDRPRFFPSSVILCGMRDVRDYKRAAGGNPQTLGTASPFNVLVESLTMDNFSETELGVLYDQHSADTGQVFTAGALERAWAYSQGQPWLCNALAREVVEKMAVPAGEPITAEHLEQARERLIRARATHLDSLVARLSEPRVRRVLEPLIAGGFVGAADAYDDDFEYVADLGLIARGRSLRVANPIYQEIIVRVLAAPAERQVPTAEPRTYLLADGRLDLRRVMEDFAAFWRQHGQVLAGTMAYHEVAPQLVLMAYLQRVVNGGGYVEREYGIGRGRIDLMVKWPWLDERGVRNYQRGAIELKVWADGRPDPLKEGLLQLDGYLGKLGLDEGVLVLFDRRSNASPLEERTGFETQTSPAGRRVTVLRG